MLRTGDRAARNYFERQAGLASGGYADKPVRPLSEGVRATLRRVADWERATRSLSADQSIVRSIPSRFADRNRCRVARSRRSRFTSSGSWARASGLSIKAFSTW